MLEVIILAAGEGTRMRSDKPKSLHCIGGRSMLTHVTAAANALQPAKIHIVTGEAHLQTMQAAMQESMHNATATTAAEFCWATQASSLGTGHAVQQAMPGVQPDSMLVLLYGDAPLITAATLRELIAAAEGKGDAGDGDAGGVDRLALLTAELDEPHGFGRIVRDDAGNIAGIVEEKDATPAQRQIRECNAGFIAGRAAMIAAALAKLDNDNAQNEFYLTDVVRHAVAAGVEVAACSPAELDEILGVNTQADRARAERVFQLRQARALLAAGVFLHDAARLDVRGECWFGRDCIVDVNVILEGEVRVGARCKIGANCIIRDSVIGDDCVVEANSLVENSRLGDGCTVGPFARLRPGSALADGARVGNFVEVKNSRIGGGAKVNHLSYVGDSEVGAGANVGAGTITCNYDGARKHRTVIGEDAFVGSNSALVAPVVIGDGATVAAGSVITADVKAGELAVGRARQTVVTGWRRPGRDGDGRAGDGVAGADGEVNGGAGNSEAESCAE